MEITLEELKRMADDLKDGIIISVTEPDRNEPLFEEPEDSTSLRSGVDAEKFQNIQNDQEAGNGSKDE